MVKKYYQIVAKEKYGECSYIFDTKTAFSNFLSYFGSKISGENSRPKQREELQGEPIINGAAGPMYNGEHANGILIRYEDHSGFFDRSKAENIYEACLESAKEDVKEASNRGEIIIGQTRFGVIHLEKVEENEFSMTINNVSKIYPKDKLIDILSYAYKLEF